MDHDHDLLAGKTVTRLFYAKGLEKFKSEKPFVILSGFQDLTTPTNLEWEQGEAERIQDLRLIGKATELDSHGFQFRECPTRFDEWSSRQGVEEQYLPEVTELLRHEVDEVDEVKIFDWRMRGTKRKDPHGPTDMNDPSDPLAPAREVHLDQSPFGVVKRVRALYGERADALLAGRVRVINVWRPLSVVENWPLLLCDGKSIGYQDLVEVDLIRKNYIGSTMYAKYRKGYEWYYLSRQAPDEVCLFKNFDSKEVPARMCPHTSFGQTGPNEGPRRRESIEVRALVFTYPREHEPEQARASS
ncbi:hypothetical protein F4780DRAFT_770020 [Xylariomycetidae sp. FL0641]|nr:hypothetical protein F4780DRAFT_770020 [Xylariomycetidae sp. FL0641]